MVVQVQETPEASAHLLSFAKGVPGWMSGDETLADGQYPARTRPTSNGSCSTIS